MKLAGEAISLRNELSMGPKIRLLGIACLERVNYIENGKEIFDISNGKEIKVIFKRIMIKQILYILFLNKFFSTILTIKILIHF